VPRFRGVIKYAVSGHKLGKREGADARHGYFGRAAEKLYVTHRAVNHQARSLEAVLNAASPWASLPVAEPAATAQEAIRDIGSGCGEVRHVDFRELFISGVYALKARPFTNFAHPLL
jgi:hypothetical protein